MVKKVKILCFEKLQDNRKMDSIPGYCSRFCTSELMGSNTINVQGGMVFHMSNTLNMNKPGKS